MTVLLIPRVRESPGDSVRHHRKPEFFLAKILALMLIAMMALHLFRPLGLPGLRRRGDVWKIAVGALIAISLTALAGHW